ncbi:MaoC family dehydratase [Cellulomonas triticagri]|uniref:MaoC-like domain-containing protein n=1 Tax=Cellulomonas triticagri TaxID=2483352 RepID=A0A3M2JJV3_9CELL|nr:MaoC/PaaZ C-terminal domain-containing protein [Cellulomonas triticagri]RMI13949.1 hypothetical protein EBM89_02315 [Cellulomonas triticagri]
MSAPDPARSEERLATSPALGGLYARAGLAAARDAVTAPVRRVLGGTGDEPADLPVRTLRLDDLRPDPAHLTAYQHLLGEPAADALPAGYLHVLAFPLTTALLVRPDFPLPALGMVHLSNRVELREPVRLGDRLDIRAWAQDLRPHPTGTQVDLVAEVRRHGAASGSPAAWHGVSTYLARGVRLGDQAGDTARPARERFEAPLPTGRWALDAGVGRRYAAVSGDANPIHLHPLSARALGFPRAIAHGMYTAARALADVGARRGDTYAWDVDFAAPVLLPSTPVVRVAPADDGWDVTAWDARRGRLHLRTRVRPLG